MDASIIPKGKSTEKGSHLPGVYVHRESGNKFITVEGEGGYIQADALNKPEWNGSWSEWVMCRLEPNYLNPRLLKK